MLRKYSNDVGRLVKEFRHSTNVTEFLEAYLQDRFLETIFSEGYGPDRAFKDGQAKEVQDLLILIGSIKSND